MAVPVSLEIKRLKSYIRGAAKTRVFLNNTEATRLWVGQSYTHKIEPGDIELFFQTWKIKTKPMKLHIAPDTSVQIEFQHAAINLFRKELIPCIAISLVIYFIVSRQGFCILGCHHLYWEMIILSMLLTYPFIYVVYAHYKNPLEFTVKVKIRTGSGEIIQEDSLKEECSFSFTKWHFILCLLFVLAAPFLMVTYLEILPSIHCWISMIFGGICHKSMYW